MNYARRSRTGLLVIGIIGALGLGYRIGKAYASGIPTTNPLVYSGTLRNGGQPVTSAQSIGLKLWPNSSPGGTPVCSVDSSTIGQTTPDSLGRFAIPLPGTCVTAVGVNQDLWVEVDVAGTRIGGLTHLGAVPYAVTAVSATRTVLTTPDAGSISIGGTYCRTSAATTGAITGPNQQQGYSAARQLCQSAGGACTATAHMCSSEELGRSLQLYGNGLLPQGWYSSPNWIGNPNTGTGTNIYECSSWTTASNTVAGAIWRADGIFDFNTCDQTNPILCCD